MTSNVIRLFILATLVASCSTTNYLETSTAGQVESNQESFLEFRYTEKLHELGHNFEPWKTTDYEGSGSFWTQNSAFIRKDTLTNSRGRTYTSLTEYTDNTLLYMDYGDEELLAMTQDEAHEKIIQTARYTPAILLQYFVTNKENATRNVIGNQAIYSLKLGKYPVEISINTTEQRVDKISYVSYDELYGDVTTSFLYSSYKRIGAITYPSRISIKKINGQVVDTVEISSGKRMSSPFHLLEKPENYQLAEAKEAEKPAITVSAYNDYLHFIELAHTDDRVMVVEFDDYMLVAEAPLTSANGELIIAEVRKIAPEKPIKYFVFGHHHPHYLGGLRAFVHKGASVLCTEISKAYVEYIAQAPHTLQPDSLQLEPHLLTTQVISGSLSLEDKMIIYFIGEQSVHTADYLLYYFPNEKLLFQDDLCWIPREGPVRKARARQVGLYNSIQELGIAVDTIIQSWPVNNHQVKTVIPFSDLEQSINPE